MGGLAALALLEDPVQFLPQRSVALLQRLPDGGQRGGLQGAKLVSTSTGG